jgi:hypothetical protein
MVAGPEATVYVKAPGGVGGGADREGSIATGVVGNDEADRRGGGSSVPLSAMLCII